ncbi:MAG: wax ester/triacylglycerol synthase family O-acyltransferase [Rhodoblastus sp.]|nr:wax ester/triacylglycerol synthase family O-acyltransferase [Rhodoblastus sp.]MCC0004729.1 wax ester/triacylglycerol synthase family O-acyltransferase [Methylobacteriaceae bacterium]
MSHSERMSPVDTAWLRMDRPHNLMMIVGVMTLEGPVDVKALETALGERMLAFHRFRQRAVTTPAGAFWVDDRHFDIARHIRRARLPGRGGEKALQRYVAQLASEPLDPNHPLWQTIIVEKYEGGAAIISRIHHAIGDGIALMKVLLGLADDGEDSRPAPHHDHHEEGWLSSLVAPLAGAAETGAKLTGSALREALAIATSPTRAAKLLKTGVGVASELAWLLAMPSDSETRFKGKPQGAKQVAWTRPLSLTEVKAASWALHCSINDILLACVAGALRAYLEDKGDESRGVELRALVPINLRPPGAEDELGNRFGILGVELPVGFADPLERLAEVRRRMLQLKSSYEPPVTLGLFGALGLAPKLAQDQLFDLLISRATAVMTNVPGPQKQIRIAGCPVKQVMFWVPQSGDIGMGVSILSYAGNVQFGLITDTALTPDPEAIIGRFEREFEGYLYHVLLEASARADEREEAEAQEEEAPRKTAPAGKEPEEDAPVMRKRAKRLRA